MHFDAVDVVVVGLQFCIFVLLLNDDLSVFVELAGKQQVVGWLDLQEVAHTERVDFPGLTVNVLDNSAWFLSKSKKVDSSL